MPIDGLGEIAAGIGALLWLVLIVRMELVVLRMYQIEEYEGRRLLRWSNQRPWNWHRSISLGMTLLWLGLLGYIIFAWWSADIVPYSWVAAGAVANLLWRWAPPKKRLVWTSRMRRLAAASVVLLAAVLVGLWRLGLAVAVPVWGGVVAVIVLLLPTLLPLLVLLAGLLLRPVEAGIRRRHLARARRRLAAVVPTAVAVAGSWGKTSTKHALAALLPEEAHAHPTRKSFNTLMGISRVINEDLPDDCRTFVVEMDPYARGEVAAMCRLVAPAHTIITSVGAQHLERFRSVEEIGDALYEAVAALPAAGTAVIYAGTEAAAALVDRAREQGRTVVAYCLEGEADGVDITARDVHQTAAGVDFRLVWPERGIDTTVHCPLLGAHQALNLTAALAMVVVLGHDLGDAVERARSLEPVEHRLQRLPTDNGIVVIDDSYNANPVGVHSGLEVLEVLAPRNGVRPIPQRILVTPGLVELGPEEEAENRRYGEHAARVCDHVIVVRATTTDALVAGLEEGGLEKASLHLVDSLDQATAVIGSVARSGDVVLFANDLPDTYL